MVRELDAVGRRVELAIRLTNDHDAGGSKHTAELLDYGIGERFAPAARKGMEQDKWRMLIETGQRVAARKRIAQRFIDLGAGTFRQFQISLDGVFAVLDFSNAVIEPARAFARVAHSVNLFGAADFSDERAAQETLEIECEIGTKFSCLLQPGQQTCRRAQSAEFTARKKMNMIDIGISAQERRPFGINDPSNISLRAGLAN